MGIVLKTNVTTDPITGLEIKPCPFCGSKASVEEVGSAAVGTAFSVGCNSNDEETCYGYQALTSFSRRSDAIKTWNKRA